MRADVALERLCADGEPESAGTVVVVAAHPDDETIGAAGRIAKLATGCMVVHVTDGAPADRRLVPAGANRMPRSAYARARREEAIRALGLAGLDPSQVLCMGVRDQEASFEMTAIAAGLGKILSDLRPEFVVTHPYEGGHPDHDAVAFAVHAAVALFRSSEPSCPAVLEMTSYHDEGGSTVRGEFLQAQGAREITVQLTDEERRTKRAMLAAYGSQRDILSRFPTEAERFRVAPRYAFGAPPHDGRLHYERFGFRMHGTMWRALARSALKKLSLPDAEF
jgi:LmbE family N-acetylglucosaminyl deacetylase